MLEQNLARDGAAGQLLRLFHLKLCSGDEDADLEDRSRGTKRVDFLAQGMGDLETEDCRPFRRLLKLWKIKMHQYSHIFSHVSGSDPVGFGTGRPTGPGPLRDLRRHPRGSSSKGVEGVSGPGLPEGE